MNSVQGEVALGTAGSRSLFASGSLMMALVVALFFVSGLTSLIYQVIWTRMLVFVFGSTTFATSTVLAVFMGGLALGSFVAGRYTDQIKRPLLAYGVLEGIIGVWAFLAPFMFDAAIPLYKAAWSLHASFVEFSLFRFVVACLILLVPTTCMGATLPLLSKFVTSSLDVVGNRVGTLYAVNTFGAVCGAMLGGFCLLPALGLHQTINIAVVANLLLTVAATALSFKMPTVDSSKMPKRSGEVRKPSQEEANEQYRTGELRRPSEVRAQEQLAMVMGAFAVSGAVAMLYEVAWTRTLLMVIGSSTYAFTVMLSTFLIGIFIGSLVMSRFVDKAKDPLVWFAAVQCMLCLAGLISVHFFNYIPYWNLSINTAFLDNPNASLAVRFLLTAVMLLPITLCLGAVFPIVVKLCARQLETVGRSVGNLYSANTLGAIVGAFMAGFFVIPAFGAERSLIYGSAMNLLLGVALLCAAVSVRKSIKVIAAGGAVACVALVAQQPLIWDRITLTAAQMERRYLALNADGGMLPSYDRWRKRLTDDFKLLFYADGTCATVGVLGDTKGPQISLLTNGHVDASVTDMDISVLIAAYPLLVHPNSQDVAVVGWGSGVTIGTAASFPTVKKVVGIEIEPAVVDASKHFDHINNLPQTAAKVDFELNDGRNYLLASDTKDFDVIISEPSNPWQAGVCNLFTKEFFGIAKKRLKDDGVFALWVQFGEVSGTNVMKVLSALKSEFSYTLPMFATDEGTMIVLASQKPISIDYDKLHAFMAGAGHPLLDTRLRQAGLQSADDLLARMITSQSSVDKWVAGSEPNTDDRNKLEYDVGRTYEHHLYLSENRQFFDKNGVEPWTNLNWEALGTREKSQICARIATCDQKLKLWNHSLLWTDKSNQFEKNQEAYRLAGLAYTALGKHDLAMQNFDEALKMKPDFVPALESRGQVLLSLGQLERARADFNKILKLDPNNRSAAMCLAETYIAVGRKPLPGTEGVFLTTETRNEMPAAALKALVPVLSDEKFLSRNPNGLLIAGVANYELGKLEEAEHLLRRFLTAKPNSVVALRALSSVLAGEGKMLESAVCWQSSLLAGQQQSAILLQRAKYDLDINNKTEAIYALSKSLEDFPGNAKALSMLEELGRTDPSARLILDRMKIVTNQ